MSKITIKDGQQSNTVPQWVQVLRTIILFNKKRMVLVIPCFMNSTAFLKATFNVFDGHGINLQ